MSCGKEWQWSLHIPWKLTLFKMTTSDAEITGVPRTGTFFAKACSIGEGAHRSPTTTDPLEGRNSHLLWLGHKLMTTKPKHKKHKHIFSHTKKKTFYVHFTFFFILLDIL